MSESTETRGGSLGVAKFTETLPMRACALCGKSTPHVMQLQLPDYGMPCCWECVMECVLKSFVAKLKGDKRKVQVGDIVWIGNQIGHVCSQVRECEDGDVVAVKLMVLH